MTTSSTPGVTASSVNVNVSSNPVLGNAADTVGFFGSVGVVQGTLPADATDLPTALVLVNALKAYVIALGLAK
jgi:hypothetical protein